MDVLRESCRQGKNRTLANLEPLAPGQVEALRQVLKGNFASSSRLEQAFDITRSRPHGHVAAVLGTIERLGRKSWTSKPAPPGRGPWP